MEESPRAEEAAPAPAEPIVARYKWTALALGALGGALSALLGVGGGVLLVPAAMLLLRLDRRRATGTTLAVILAAALAGAARYRQEGLLHGETVWQLWGVVCLAVGEIAGALVGARLAGRARQGLARRVLGILVVVAGMALVLAGAHPTGAAARAEPLPLLGVGALAGVVSSALGLGGELALIPLLVFVLAFPQRLAQGTSLAVIVLASLSGVLIHVVAGNVVWGFVFWMGAGALAAAWLTAGGVGSLSPETLRLLFSAYLMLAGVSMVTHREDGAGRGEGLGVRG